VGATGGSVTYEQRGAAAWITINRPDRRNAFNEDVANGIIAGIDRAEADGACRAIVLTGAGGDAFCAGGDLKPGGDGAPFDVPVSDPRNFAVRMLRRIEGSTLPVVARVNGHALAGGFGLLCACDVAVAVDTARFGVPEARVGLFPMMILPFMLRVLPPRTLMELCLTGEPITAAEALAAGVVNYVAPAGELDAKVDWLLARMTDKSPTAVRLGKIGLKALRDMELNQALEYAQLMLGTMAKTEDAREGFAAFREKRTPNWTGR
jgi:enoyl-CoA hydratase/carnithine racemase